MSELLNDIRAEIQVALEKREGDLYRDMSRTAIINTDGVDVELTQYKFLSDSEIDHVRANGPAILANREWFNNVKWIQQLSNDDHYTWDQLRLDALYPVEFFAERPISGVFDGNGRWSDQYGGISGFGNHDAINTWSLSFVDTDNHAVQRLSYPSDPTAIDTYNARYRQYLAQLDAADVTIGHYRAWDHPLTHNKKKTPRTIGGLSLVGIGVYEVLRQGTSSADTKVDSTRILLDVDKPNKNEYVGRDITIIDDEAVTELLSSGEDDRRPADEKLLTTTLKLIQDANKVK